ncbi:TonB-dependent receptor [Acidobacteria bacterium AB60]|nr:TonB-dependent receptor [Acidobacteria bacterium AB60]
MKLGYSIFVSFLLSSLAFAQSTNATISGGVTDPSGNFIVNAEVEIANDATGIVYSATTNSSGMYLVLILPPGHYHVQVSRPGFKTIIKPDVVLNVQSALALNFTLPVGATSESVTVGSASAPINTTDASVSTVIDQQFVQNMPLNGRSFQDLISMTPGISTASPQVGGGEGAIGASGDFSVNGQRTESNSYSVDGVSANVGAGNGYGVAGPAVGGSVAASSVLGTTQGLVSVDALEEFRVLSSTYSAEFGRSPGGQFSFLTKSGADQFHGSGFDYLRNNFFDANDWFNDHYGNKPSALRQNDFGLTIGGPVLPHRNSFFFFSYEGLRLAQPQADSVQLVPDQNLRDQAPPAIQAVLNAFPRPTPGGIDYGSASNPSLAQFLKPYTVPSQIDSTSLRLDKAFADKLALFFRAAYSPSSAETRSLSVLSQLRFGTETYTLGATSQLSKKISNDFRLGFARSDARVVGTLDDFGGATPINLASAVGQGAPASAQLAIFLEFAGAGYSELLNGATGNGLRQWNAVNTFAWTAGKHAFKFGIDYRHVGSPIQPATLQMYPLFFGLPDVLNNAPTITSVLTVSPAMPVLNEFAAFAQDEWRLRPSLTLSLGLRWEVNPPPTGSSGRDAYTLSGDLSEPSTLAIAPRGTRLWQTPWLNFAPRLGVAWQARSVPGWETVFRSGGGVFFDSDNQVAGTGFSGVGFGATANYFGAPLPLSPQQIDLLIRLTPPYGTVSAFPAHLQLPYALEWNASLEQAVGKAQSLTISYVGSSGRRQLEEKEVSLASLNPNFTYGLFFDGRLSSSYSAMQMKFQRTLAHGLEALASYTWSHAIDFGSTYAALYVLRGNADFDVRNSFSTALSWDLPSGATKRWTRPLFDGWGLDARFIARSAFPLSIKGNFSIDPATGTAYYTGVNLVPNERLYLEGPNLPGGRGLNPAAFATPSGSNIGNAPRNFARGFGETQLNMAVRREFRPIDRVRIQFRAESFNLVNHPNFGYVDPVLTDATFGQSTKMLNQSLGSLASQYQQGGPRSFQFALKALF